jgi:hypothetical protein
MFDMERFNLKKLNNMEVKEQYQVKISNGECLPPFSLVYFVFLFPLYKLMGVKLGLPHIMVRTQIEGV